MWSLKYYMSHNSYSVTLTNREPKSRINLKVKPFLLVFFFFSFVYLFTLFSRLTCTRVMLQLVIQHPLLAVTLVYHCSASCLFDLVFLNRQKCSSVCRLKWVAFFFRIIRVREILGKVNIINSQPLSVQVRGIKSEFSLNIEIIMTILSYGSQM